MLAVDQGLIDVAADLLDEAEFHAADVGSPPWVDGRVDQYRGVIAVHRGNYEDARSIARAALARTTSPAGRSHLLNALGSLEIATRLGNIESRAVDLGNLAEIELLAGNPHAAARRQLECLDIALELGSLREVTSSWSIAARLAAMSGDWETATRLQSASDATMTRIGTPSTYNTSFDASDRRGRSPLGQPPTCACSTDRSRTSSPRRAPTASWRHSVPAAGSMVADGSRRLNSRAPAGRASSRLGRPS